MNASATCKICLSSFFKNHFNQTLCSNLCKIKSRKIVLNKYKESGKKLLSSRKLYKSDKKKMSDKKYRQTKKAKELAVKRVTKYLNSSEEILEEKRRINRIYVYRTQGRLKKWFNDKSKYGCNYCGKKYRLSIDHIIPRSKNGNDEISNLQVLCVECNSKKGNKIWQK